jgi:hypothetical protein
MFIPPDTEMVCPVINLPSSEASIATMPRRFFSRLRVDVEDSDLAAFICESERQSSANSLSTAGHNGDFSR